MAFTGRAIYDSGVFAATAEDVSEEISMISPSETPLLNRLAQAERPARSVLHEWLEEKLNLNTLSTSATAGSAVTTIEVHDGSGGDAAQFVQVGAIFEVTDTGEYVQVTATSGDILTIARGYGTTSGATITAGTSKMFFIGDAALEGADVSVDISQPRVRKTNYCQVFKKDIIVSGTVEATDHLGINSEMDTQRDRRMREALRDLEKSAIRGKTSGNSIGSSTARRAMDGILARLTTNVTSTATLTPSILDDVIKTAWDNGATDLDLIVAGSTFKGLIDTFNSSRTQTTNNENAFRNQVTVYESTYTPNGIEVQLNRWMPALTLAVISTERCRVVPLQGRSFQIKTVAPTGDAEKAMVIGEYTMEIKNEEGMAVAAG